MAPLSRYLSDDELRAVLVGCKQGVEHFHPHPDYPAYVIGSWGVVFSTRSGRFLRPELNRGYYRVDMPDRKRRVHQLVLEAFVGPRPDGCEGCHWDGDRTNNRLENLRWDTPDANRLDRRRHRWAARRAERAYVADALSRVALPDRAHVAALRRQLDSFAAAAS